jgi:hypothetical protein
MHVDPWSATSTLTLIDADSFVVLGTAEIDGVAVPLRFNESGTSLLGMASPRSKKHRATLWSLETKSVATTAVGDLGRGVERYFTDPTFAHLYVVAGTKKSKPKTISVFDVASLRPPDPLASVEHLTMLQLSPDGRWLYALCDGHAHKKPKGPPGNLHLLDATTGAELARLQAGQSPSSVEFDVKRGLAYVMGTSDPEGHGTLTVLRGTAVAARIGVPGLPGGLRLAPDGASFLLTSRAVVALDAEGLAATHTWDLTFGPSDLIFDPAHDLMFAGAGAGSKIAEMRISGGDVLVEHPTGNAGRKFGKGLGEAVYFVLAVAAAAGGGAVSTPFVLGGNSTSMVLGDGGATLYILNPYTNDISIFDVSKQDVVGTVHIGGGSPRIVRLPDDPDFWVETRDRLAHFDTRTNRVDRTFDFHAGILYRSVSYDPVRERAWISIGTKVLVFDLRAGKVIGQADLPKSVTALWIDSGRKPEP